MTENRLELPGAAGKGNMELLFAVMKNLDRVVIKVSPSYT